MVIPTYQCARYIGRALDSVLAQSYPSSCIEIIVVDDGSFDNTSEVLRPYRRNIKHIQQANLGLSIARNTAIKASRGEYVAFLDADDYWLPQRLEAMIEAMSRATDRLIMTDYWREREGKRWPFSCYHEDNWRFSLSAERQYDEMLKQCWARPFVLMSRNILSSVGLFDEALRFAEDWDLLLRCLAGGYRLFLVSEPLAVYEERRSGSVSNDGTAGLRKVQDKLHVLNKHRTKVSREQILELVGSIDYHTTRDQLARGMYGSAVVSAMRVAGNYPYVVRTLMRGLMRRPSMEHLE